MTRFRKPTCFAIFFISVASLTGSKLGALSQQNASDKTREKKIDVCTLLTRAEVEAIQGESVIEAKKSPQLSGSFAMSQCVYKTVTPARSVSVALAAPSSEKAVGPTPRQLWRQQFDHPSSAEAATHGKFSKKKGDQDNDEDENESTQPQPISGLGEQAYWMGNPVAGALYVLQGERFVRISVGGVPKQDDRIEKATKLARQILTRLK